MKEATMLPLDKTAWEVLNATADDWENLEQIYHLVCFEFSSDNYDNRGAGAYYLRPARGAPSLEEIADCIRDLFTAGLLEARLDDEKATPDAKECSYVWRAWFRMTPQGRTLWASSEMQI
jgi:hypothetical protein